MSRFHSTETTVTTVGDVALFTQSVMTRERDPKLWVHRVTVEAGAGAYTVEGKGAGGIWVTLSGDGGVAEADAFEVRKGFSQFRVTVTTGEADVYATTMHEFS